MGRLPGTNLYGDEQDMDGVYYYYIHRLHTVQTLVLPKPSYRRLFQRRSQCREWNVNNRGRARGWPWGNRYYALRIPPGPL